MSNSITDMSINLSKLKFCPFCGNRPEIRQFSHELKDVGFSYVGASVEACIRCTKCKASTGMVTNTVKGMYPNPEDELKAIEQAVNLWEQRINYV